MDSGNSESSSQSTSSCGDGEYDSRAATTAETISPSLLNTLSNHLITPNQQPPQHHHHQHQHPNLPSSFFDPLTNFNNVNPLLNFDMFWSKGVRSGLNCNDLVGLMQAPVPSQGQNMSASYALIHQGSDTHDLTMTPNNNNSHATAAAAATTTTASAAATTNNNSNNSNSLQPVRNPKKRSRASRRAPTTVLTTDTTNFRAMVQEFTGIPSPPFTSSAFPRSRLDLFTTNPYPLRRPLAQKIQKNPLSVSTPYVSRIGSDSTIDALTLISPTATRKNTFLNPASVDNYQLPPSSLVEDTNMQGPVLNLQSLLQGPIKFPLSNSVFIGSKNQGAVDQNLPAANVQSHSNMGSNNIFEELGLSHGGNVISTQQQSSRNDHQGLLGSLNGDYGESNHHHHHHQAITNGKINCSNSSATEFHGNNNNVNARTEGMVESWIRSSD